MSLASRLRFLSVAVIVVALVLIAKLYEVQIVRGDVYKARADHQYVEGGNYFDRGSIFFTVKDGSQVPAAGIKSGFILAIDPQTFRQMNADRDAIYERLNAIYPIERSVWDAKASREYDPYEELGKRIPSEVAEQVRALQIPGVSVYKQDWRVYPGGEMAAHALGFMGYGGADGTEYAGRYGLERFYEPVLVREGDKAFVNFFAEVFSDIKKTITPGESLEGDIVTTIEPKVQVQLQDELNLIQEKYASDFSGGIVIDPNTGEIVAMALAPSFDPNSPQSADSAEIFSNKLIEDRYEMGSIVKALTMAAGLDSGAVTRKSVYNDPGCQTLDKKTFCNFDKKSHGSAVPMQVVLSKSLNTGVAHVVKQMGNARFRDYMLRLGLDEKTGIDLPNEGKSLISNLSAPRDLEYAQASFGQGIALTPVQMTRALSALANGGHLVTPHLVKEIKYEIGLSKDVKPELGKQVFEPGTSEEISRMLTEVVDYALKDGRVRLPNYSVAAKTGTAQIANPDEGGYYEDHYLHSFFGYFPSYEPRFLVFLYTFHPKGVQYASETLTDSFMHLTKFLISYYNIAPDREAPPPQTARLQ
jgi:cell division protein FtsI/penicillin-binding protein 2